MDDNSLPNDLAECHQLLLAAFKQSVQLEQQAAEAKQQAEQVAELKRVLDETATSYKALQQEHAATLDELAWYKRWTFGRRRERFTEGRGQGQQICRQRTKGLDVAGRALGLDDAFGANHTCE